MWILGYSNEAGIVVEREFTDAGAMWDALTSYGYELTEEVNKASREGYSLQTHTFTAPIIREDVYVNQTLSVVDLDTHTRDGYTHEEAAELDAETNYSVVVTLEADMPTAPMAFGTNATGADSAARMATAILACTGEPQPLRPTHEDYRTVYRASGYHDVFGEWSVDLVAYDRGEICGTCGEWFEDSDAWGEHNDMAHY